MTPRPDDQGFTLTELLVVLVIMPLIVGAIAVAVIASFRDQNGISGRLSDSTSAQITSAFYTRDVQSATLISTGPSVTSPHQCGFGTSSVNAMSLVVGLNWGSPSATGTVVSYWYSSVSGSLVRLFCTGGTTTPASTVTVAIGLAAGSGASAAISPANDSAVAQSGWAATAGTSSLPPVSAVTLAAFETSSSYNFTLTAGPRASQAEAGTGGTGVALLLLGSGSSVLGCSGGSSNLNIVGSAVINSTSNPSGSISGGAKIVATPGPIYSAEPTPATAISTSGGSSVTPTPIAGGPVQDPYLALTPPSTAGLPTYSSGTYQGPGVYTTTLTIGSNTTLATGTYIFQNGFTLSGTHSLSSAAGGVLLYVSGGQINLSGGSGINLQPLTPAPYPSASDLVIWQNSTDTSTLNLSGGSGLTAFGGLIYAPGATVGGSGGSNYSAASIIANAFQCSGGTTTTIG